MRERPLWVQAVLWLVVFVTAGWCVVASTGVFDQTPTDRDSINY